MKRRRALGSFKKEGCQPKCTTTGEIAENS